MKKEHRKKEGIPNRPLTGSALESGGRSRVLDWVLTSVMILVTVGLCVTTGGHLRDIWAEKARNSARHSLLESVYSRQNRLLAEAGYYADSVEELRALIEPEIAEKLHLITWHEGKRPQFLAEYCDELSCMSIDSEGGIREAVRLVVQTDDKVELRLLEGRGRLFSEFKAPRTLNR